MPGSKLPKKKGEAAAPAAQTAPPLPPPLAGKEEEEELPAAQTAPPLPPPVAGKEQEEELPAPAPAPVPQTIQVTMYDISGVLRLALPEVPPADLAVRTLPADATQAQIQRAAEILLAPYIVGGGGHAPYHTSSDDEAPLTDDDFDDYVGGGDGDAVGWSGGWSGGPAPTPWRPEDFEFILGGIKPIHTSAADQDQDQVDIRKAKRLVGKDLEKEFKATSAFVQACTFGVPEGHYLRFYGLHKVATEGLCYAPQPSPRNLKSHAEW